MSNESAQLMRGMQLRPEFVMLNLEAGTNMQAIESLANNLAAEGVVKESFTGAILKREADYCTGLAFEEMGIAIPHTDAEHVNEASIGIAVLNKPVTFQSMGMPDIPCEVEMLFMLAIKEPELQLEFLQELMNIFGTKDRLINLKNCKTPQELTKTFKSYFE